MFGDGYALPPPILSASSPGWMAQEGDRSGRRACNGAAWARAAPGNRPRAPPERPVDAASASPMLRGGLQLASAGTTGQRQRPTLALASVCAPQVP